ncbi:stromal membrane-associated protein 1 isoform X2 [Coccinella septempunctata]|nr:stromal membrane-associated protein 1 isoform X2 [Coccinella septempunctata]XP_044744526.1 stromal membrane-associated protein 1 isoform X2 [Coccinella septempunctata]
MNSKIEKDKAKQLQEKCQSVLTSLLRDEDNKYCVDCDSKGPRWASWNIGVFLCIRCAGIHRNLGVHISRVKSVNLDTWTPEQVVSLQQMGNSRARAVYEANLPDDFRRPQNDSNLESFIRAKYEHKKYIAREWVPAPLPKVNWEKEIEDEMERQKRKTKTVVEKKPLPSVEVPQLPKPKNPSPKPNRIINTDKTDSDLLIAQNSEDFSGFLSSAPKTEEKKETLKNDIKSEEESFFNQTLPTEKEKVQLSKDSIMKLYSNMPMNNFNQFHNPLGQPAYQANIPVQNSFQNFGCFPQQAYPIQNGMVPQYSGQQFPNQCIGQQFPLPNQMQVPVGHVPHPAYQVPQNQFTSFQSNLQMSMSNQLNHFGQNYQPAQSSFLPTQQPPFTGTQTLNQQFGKLNLNGQQPSNASPGMTNIWP